MNAPIALDFEAAGWHDPHGKWPRQCAALDAQLRALVARVAQEEREKWEPYAQHRSGCACGIAGCTCGLDKLRGT